MNLKPAIILVCVAWLFSPSAAADQPIRLRVLSYNIHHAEGIDGALNLERIASVITSVDPDLVALQEVDQGAKRTRSVDQPSELAHLTNMNVVFGANIDLQGGRYGNAILSRFPVLRHTNHFLPSFDNGEQRGVIEADIRVSPERVPVVLFATHLDHRRDDRERLASADAINQLISKRPGHPALLMGDLNATAESETLKRLESRWTNANKTPLPTIPVGRPTRQIDFILYRPANRWRIIETRVLDEVVASDHRAIFSVLELFPETRP